MVERDENGRIVSGQLGEEHRFSEGEHWRDEKPYWNEEWLRREYVRKGRSAADIASEFDCTAENIRYHLRKHGVERRTISEAREVKDWGVSGEENGMYGRTGEENPNWKGGVTPERQAFYSSQEWADACQTVWQRDDATCQRCNVQRGEYGEEFHIHHIVSFSVEELRDDPSNLVLLCEECHQWVHSAENTEDEFLATYE
jgi:hypothetical protein